MRKRNHQLASELNAARYHWQLANSQVQGIQQEIALSTGYQSADELISAWRRLCYRLGYALNHVEDFEPEAVLREQLATIGSEIRLASQGSRGKGRDLSGTGNEFLLLLDGLTLEQLARLACYILDGYYLEGAFSRLHITVLTPIGQLMAKGQLPINTCGATVSTY
ncbi:hypothetical protein [Hymenobacter sp. GOD-10R]|uniref:hypothetical protein n=1 Tax=Hymenobacter sp. GOD-10R TaxID=3093922 RepID=UPI002D785331|nr:hypothetical protein [Hymenobacter sp. GOD-10R]WRQ31611.1 hypothetical protein SD425_27655 [Hymenobacter sp. GOD-10R]